MTRVHGACSLLLGLLLAGLPVLAQPSARPNVILISVDTLRADRVSCISSAAQPTPHIDRLCQGGSAFSQATSMVPLTLPSHVSMLTSTYPFVDGVEDNGDRLAPGATTLAGTLHSHGYQTAAFLGSFVLDRRFGLDQGFDTYDSPAASLNSGSDAGDIKRRGDAVANAAEAWLGARADRPFFLFLHLYDLHTPYEPGKDYDSELAYADQVIGQFWDYLAAHDLVNKSLIVFTSDHGEGLGDHGESTHGFFIYQSTLHVPLIFHWPARSAHWPAGHALMPERVDTPASLLDLSPTILDAVRIPLPHAMEGKSLLAAGDRTPEAFSESEYPALHFGANALSSLRLGHYKYIEAPKPEFYDLVKDPGESINLYPDKNALASAYREKLKQMRQHSQPRSPRSRNELSPEVVARLHALGYLTENGSARNSAPSGIDAKDRIADYEKYGTAIYAASLGHLEEASTILKEILTRDRDLSDVRLALGLNQQRMGKDSEAIEQFRLVLAAEPASALAHLDTGLSYYNLRQFDNAAKELLATLAISPGYTKAEIFLGRTLAQQGDYDKAAAEFNQVLKETPDSYDAHDGLGTLAAMRGDWKESEQQLKAALSMEPAAAESHNTLGSVYLRTGEIALAQSEFEEAIRLKPNYATAHYNLGMALTTLKDGDGAKSEFQKALVADPNYLPARDALDRLAKSSE